MIRLAHLSDPHLGPLPATSWRDLIGKRVTGFVNYSQGRVRSHDMAILARLVDDVAAQAPDHVVVTGDLVNIGLLAEYPIARQFLEAIGPADRVSTVPGNHDAYVRGALESFVSACGAWMTSDGGQGCSFPYVRRRGGIALIGVSSGVPTAPFVAAGRLGLEQRDRLENALADLGREGLTRVLLIHHPPHRAGSKPGRNLTDAAELEAIVARVGCELILHGHNHVDSLDRIPGPSRPTPILGAPSASAASARPGRRAGWFLITIDQAGVSPVIRAELRRLSANGETFDVAGRYDL